MIPGEYILGEGAVIANARRRTLELEVANTGDRPIQVGSHYHFFEANKALLDHLLQHGAAIVEAAADEHGTHARPRWPR